MDAKMNTTGNYVNRWPGLWLTLAQRPLPSIEILVSRKVREVNSQQTTMIHDAVPEPVDPIA